VATHRTVREPPASEGGSERGSVPHGRRSCLPAWVPAIDLIDGSSRERGSILACKCFCRLRLGGPFGPLIPFATACADAGHEVKVGCGSVLRGGVVRAGFDHAPFADAPPEIMGPSSVACPNCPFEEATRR
jgi:hypothetical protein